MPTNPVLATKDPFVLIDRIKRAFPDLTRKDYKFIEAGWDHEVIQLDNKYIFRFPNSPEYLSVLKDEIQLLHYLSKQTKARIPNYTYVAKDFSFGGYAMLPGIELSSELFINLHEGVKDIVAKDIADFLTDLHSLNINDLTHIQIATVKPFGGYNDNEALAEKYLKPNLSGAEYEQIQISLKEISIIQKYKQPSRLTHGDIAPKHLIWHDNDEVLGFIDFSDRSIADPAIDFAELYTYGERFVDRAYELYRGPDKHPQFLTRAKAYMKAIGIHSLANTYRTDRMKYDDAMQLLKIGNDLHIKH